MLLAQQLITGAGLSTPACRWAASETSGGRASCLQVQIPCSRRQGSTGQTISVGSAITDQRASSLWSASGYRSEEAGPCNINPCGEDLERGVWMAVSIAPLAIAHCSIAPTLALGQVMCVCACWGVARGAMSCASPLAAPQGRSCSDVSFLVGAHTSYILSWHRVARFSVFGGWRKGWILTLRVREGHAFRTWTDHASAPCSRRGTDGPLSCRRGRGAGPKG